MTKMQDMLRKTSIYQEILKEGREEGLEALRQAVVDIIAQRYPKLARLAKKQSSNFLLLTRRMSKARNPGDKK